jgi:hypothetical protein
LEKQRNGTMEVELIDEDDEEEIALIENERVIDAEEYAELGQRKQRKEKKKKKEEKDDVMLDDGFQMAGNSVFLFLSLWMSLTLS